MPGPVIVAILELPLPGDKFSQGDAVSVLPEGQGPGNKVIGNESGRYAFIEVTNAGAGQAGVDAVLATGVLESVYEPAINLETMEDEGGAIRHARRKGNNEIAGWPPGQVAKARDWDRKVPVTLEQLTSLLAEKA